MTIDRFKDIRHRITDHNFTDMKGNQQGTRYLGVPGIERQGRNIIIGLYPCRSFVGCQSRGGQSQPNRVNRVRDPRDLQLIWAENRDVCRSGRGCLQAATTNLFCRGAGQK